MAELLVGIDTMPTFRNGYPLSADSLNRIGAGQRYLDGRYSRPLPAIPYVNWGGNSTIVHLHRYLHYNLYQFQGNPTRTFRLLINNRAVEEVVFTNGDPASGVIDLEGDALDSNPIGLTVGTPYTLKWQLISGTTSWWDGVYGRELWETDSSDGSLSFPESAATFSDGQVPMADDLNAISANTEYLLVGGGLGHTPGFLYQETGIQPNGTASLWYRMRHSLPRLYVRADIDCDFGNNTIEFWVNVNGSELYHDEFVKAEGPDSHFPYALNLDLSTLGFTVGQWYTIEIKVYKSAWNSVVMRVFYAGESPEDGYP